MPTLCLILVSWLFLLVVPLQAKEHKFLDKTNIILHSMNAAVQGFDYWTTERGLSRGASERNPLGQSRRNRLILKSVGIGGGLGLAYILHRAKLHKAERWIPVIIAVPSGIAATYNLRF